MPKLIGDKPLTPAERSKRWREKNPERAKEVQENYLRNHPEAAKEASRKYYKRNAKKENERTIRYRKSNKARVNAHGRKSWHKNRDRNLKKNKIYFEKNPHKPVEYSNRRRARVSKAITYKILDKELLRIKNSACYFCKSKESVQMDHIIPISRGGSHGIGNLQPLCKSCNLSKGSKFMMEWRLMKENN